MAAWRASLIESAGVVDAASEELVALAPPNEITGNGAESSTAAGFGESLTGASGVVACEAGAGGGAF